MSTPKAAVASFAVAFVLTISLFAIWGMGQQLSGMLLPQIAGPLHLQGIELTISQNVTNVVYMLCAIPAAFYATRLGYKAAILCALSCIVLGCFTLYPTVVSQAHSLFLLAMTSMAIGWVFLDIAANPLAASLGSEANAVRNLNIAQAAYPLGTLLAIVYEKWLLNKQIAIAGMEITFSIALPYILLGIGVMLIAYLFEDKRFPAVANERHSGGEGVALKTLLTDRPVLIAMAAQGFAILVLITNGVAGERILAAAFDVDVPGPLSNVVLWSTLAFAAGRLCASALMCAIPPERLLALFAIAGLACSLLATSGWITLAGWAVLANQFFAALAWPTVLGLAIRGKGPLMKMATALVCMGGAIGCNIFALAVTAWPSFASQLGMLLPALCFAAIFGFALAFGAFSHRGRHGA